MISCMNQYEPFVDDVLKDMQSRVRKESLSLLLSLQLQALKTAFESFNDDAAVEDLAGRLVRLNPAFKQVHGVYYESFIKPSLDWVKGALTYSGLSALYSTE